MAIHITEVLLFCFVDFSCLGKHWDTEDFGTGPISIINPLEFQEQVQMFSFQNHMPHYCRVVL